MVIGSDKIFAIENFYVRHLQQWNDVYHFPAQSMFYDYYDRNLINKLIFKLNLSRIYQEINEQLKQKIQHFNPDVIWVFKGMEVLPQTLEWARSRNIKLVNYNPDNPFIFSGAGSGNRNVSESIGFFDLHFTYNLEIKKELQQRYMARVEDLPFGFEIDESLYAKTILQQEVIKICFLGNPDVDRAAFIQNMAKAGLKIDVYGHNWKKFIDHSNVTLLPPVYGADLWYTLYKYRVQLNLMRQHNLNSHNMRTFEVPGTGGILLAPATKEHLLFFEDNKEAFFYADMRQAIEKATFLLNLPAVDANNIRMLARKRSVSSGYTYQDRAKFVSNTLNSL
jgi:spore maturation protein CgeB